ncbi:MAG: pyridoxamine 5'-phosphate oxidase family protein [Chitinophagaceae bacterium]|nr:pyridoxamine 5'-phosphate oxidase family protein [Anaerolineae bacterium]
MHVSTFNEIAEAFITIVHSEVWCNVATTDSQNRPRSRVLHPIWENHAEGTVGWITTGRNTVKAKHLAHNPNVSASYMKNPMKPVYIDCAAEWVDVREEKQRILDLFRAAPPPLGYDPEKFLWFVDNADSGLLKLIPWRIELADLFGETRVWQASS